MLLTEACNDGQAARQYIFLGHPYNWHHPYQVDPRLEQLNYEVYDEIWLGGDVCSRTAEVPQTMQYLDSIFDFQKVRWTLGNHDVDYGEPEHVLQQLPHPEFFTEWKEGFCLSVLNTNYLWPYPSMPPQKDCKQKNDQWEMLQNVADTISEASHWLILHHHALFSDLKITPSGDTLQDFNVNAMLLKGTCDSTSSVTDTWYPLLLEVQKKGVQVVLIGGDVGMQSKQSEFQTPHGIWLLGSGINNTVPREHAPEYVKDFGPDKVLIVSYTQARKELEWSFTKLNELLRQQQ